jgi:hypothetical protein
METLVASSKWQDGHHSGGHSPASPSSSIRRTARSVTPNLLAIRRRVTTVLNARVLRFDHRLKQLHALLDRELVLVFSSGHVFPFRLPVPT